MYCAVLSGHKPFKAYWLECIYNGVSLLRTALLFSRSHTANCRSGTPESSLPEMKGLWSLDSFQVFNPSVPLKKFPILRLLVHTPPSFAVSGTLNPSGAQPFRPCSRERKLFRPYLVRLVLLNCAKCAGCLRYCTRHCGKSCSYLTWCLYAFI